MPDNKLLRAALAYAARLHWPVFPLTPHGKTPLTPHGYKDATLDEKQIREWWREHPDGNIGLPTGNVLWALDTDPRNGGAESLELLIYKNSGLPDTIQQITGGGGRHHAWAPDPRIKCGTFMPGLDYKGIGGYIVVAPSIHPSGRAYEWDGLTRITEQKLLRAPDWLIAEILKDRANGNGKPIAPERIPKGKQHDTLFKLGCAMRSNGLDEAEILAALWEVNQNRCEEPGPRKNIEQLAHSICTSYAAGFSKSSAKPQAAKPLPDLHDSVLEDVYHSDYPEPLPIIDAILYPGLTLFAGRPKIGKSWLAMQLALAIISGNKFADYLEVKQPGRCLYLALEERPRQTRSRIRQLTPPNDFLANATYIYEIPALMAGGAALLDSYLTEHKFDVVIVDSLLAITKQAGRKGLDLMQTDYNIVATLRDIAEKHSIAVIVVAHTRKAPGEFIDAVQGTSGTTAAADAIWVMQRMPDGRVALSVTGRELESNVFALERCGDCPAWKITGEGDEIQQGEERREIVELIREMGPMKPLHIARAVRKNVGAVQRLLSKLVQSGQLIRSSYGTYQLPPNARAAGMGGSSG